MCGLKVPHRFVRSLWSGSWMRGRLVEEQGSASVLLALPSQYMAPQRAKTKRKESHVFRSAPSFCPLFDLEGDLLSRPFLA